MKYTTLLFDLDGTLTDSEPGIVNGVRLALREFDIDPDPELLRSFIGPSLYASFRHSLHFSEDDARHAVAVYRSYYNEQGLFENAVYEGILPLLDELAASGRRLFVATAKPEHFARRICDHFALTPRFITVHGADQDCGRVEKDQVIRHVLDVEGLQPQQVLMIGDRKYDILGAQANGVDALGVLYGYGDQEELHAAGAKHMAATVADMRHLLLSGAL